MIDDRLDEIRKGALAPNYFHQWNRAYRGAYMKGRRAFHAGAQLADNPYQDIRKPSGRLSWSRAFWNCWRDGWFEASQGWYPSIDTPEGYKRATAR